MENIKDKITAIQQNGYEIDFSNIFNNAFENYKKTALISGFAILLFSIVIIAIAMGIVFAFLGFSSFADTLPYLKPENFSGITILIYIIIITLITGLTSPITAGLLKISHCAAHGKEFSITTTFDYYNSAFFKELFIATTLITICSVSVNTVLESLGIRFIGTIFTYIISFFSFLTIPLIIFGNLKALDAIQGSFIIVSKQILLLLGLLLVSIILVCLGIFGFCIGIFFTIPFIYSMYYCIYKEVIEIDDEV
ncbi:hypothetical protein [Flavobacterium psychrotolerans]|uniref:Beta-carotene 15,15'-monooxygenase n=1 Tax=Flavobacterium psychrotolerans TaxID=2169410 RepID=A0A2U1JFZ9_9FLAO|nr:hypothetical protein [Flavobacterium psychrotolerans]PWA03868.1 hypothetical protein DB895_13955 [Flavobacterium psychrotolerans]